MFRIHFSPARGMWLVQFNFMGLFWVTVRDTDGTALLFRDLQAAEQYVALKGIDDVYYRQANPNTRDTAFYGMNVRHG